MNSNGDSLVIRMGGESGEGIVTIGEVFVRIAARSGLEVFTFRTYPAEIMGGHVVYQARIGRDRVLSDGDEMDVLVALNEEGYQKHIEELRPGGTLVYDSSVVEPPDDGRAHYPVPVTRLSDELEFPRGKNLVMVGALVGLFGLPADRAKEVVVARLGKYRSLLPKNEASLAKGLEYVQEHYRDRLPPQLEPPDELTMERLVMTGNQAAALGALAAGCRFYAGYPITPATDIMEYMAQNMPALGG
jgi:2-oxoglutarate ferredoxin oxidoreductase subunit alpha